MNETIKEGDIVRYPVGMFGLSVRKVYKDDKGDLYINQLVLGENYPRYIYKTMDGYQWDTRLCKELGFGICKEHELQYLKD